MPDAMKGKTPQEKETAIYQICRLYPFLRIAVLHNPLVFHGHVFFADDDWVFVKKRPYISLTTDVLRERQDVGQVLLNENYATRFDEDDLKVVGSGTTFSTRHEVKWVLHGTDRSSVVSSMSDVQRGCCHWPHFALRPGLFRATVFGRVVPRFFSELGGTHVPYGITLKRFARDFSTRWKTGFLKGIHTVLAAPSLKPEKIATSGPLLKTRFALSAEMTLENTHVFIDTWKKYRAESY